MTPQPLDVLLIEDDLEDAQLVTRALTRGSTPITARVVTSLSAGLAEIAPIRPDVILTDLSLPDSEGLDTVARLRRESKEIPIVVLTGCDDGTLAMSLLKVGAQDYLVKGCFSHDGLERAILYSIQRQHSNELLERKNRKLEKLYAQANQFVDNVSHEFRTPLTVIKEYVSIIRDGLAGEVTAEQQRMLTVVEDRADDLNIMVDDMLDVSKLEAGMLGAWRRNCLLPDIIQHTSAALERKAKSKRVRLEWDVPNDLPEVYCDDEKVGRIVCNLAINSLKFCGDPGQVRIAATTDPDGHDVIVSVSDNGPGIDDASLEMIFARFAQLETSIQSSTKGFGLGLGIAKELVDLNFGSMNVESTLGVGSTFSFTIPVAEPPEIICRYLQRLSRVDDHASAEPFVSIITAAVDQACSCSVADECDRFLNCHLRKNDVIFRTSPTSWLIALSEPESELVHYFRRVRNGLAEANRNRPSGPLPEFDYAVEGSWRAVTDQDRIVRCVENAVQNSETCCA